MPDVVNLTLVRVHIAGWESWSPATSPTFRARHLAAHDERVLPIVRAFGGRRIEARDGGSLFAFRSPTDAVHCAAALQDATAGGVRPWDEVGRLELQIGVHQGEVHLDRKGASGAPLATVQSLAEGADVLDVWLTRGVYLTMSRSEAPAEEMGPRALAGMIEPVPTYRLVRSAGPSPYGGRGGVAPRPRRSGALSDLALATASVRIAGETEGRFLALARVLASGAALLFVRALERGIGGLHAAIYRAHRALFPWTPRSRALDRLLAVLERARRIVAVHEPGLELALRRPGA
jgi:class 3 adenylate cyclase